jgi:hypothetical protein
MRRLPGLTADVRHWANELIRVLDVNLGDLDASTHKRGKPIELAAYAKADLPSADKDGLLIFVTDDVGGAVPAFSSGGQWLRVTDRAVIS